jgi:hypothetical protein
MLEHQISATGKSGCWTIRAQPFTNAEQLGRLTISLPDDRPSRRNRRALPTIGITIDTG